MDIARVLNRVSHDRLCYLCRQTRMKARRTQMFNPFHKKDSIETLYRKNSLRLIKEQLEKEKVQPLSCDNKSFVSLKNIQKIYPNGFHSVIDFNLGIKQGEFVVFVGPSGCGKSTTLRMISGLEEITAGALFIDGVKANEIPPSDRGISMVFQNYALFPHLTVYENIAYGISIRKYQMPLLDKDGNQVYGINQKAIKELQKERNWILKNYPENTDDLGKIDHDINEYQTKTVPLYKKRKLNKKEIDEKVRNAAKILNLENLLNRKPGQLSGGQCQRVALGRVIVSDAKLLLMDEPLSNLDAKLRVSMRSEIIDLHKKIGATTIYVTHDQIEAMTMSDRLVVMNKGEIIQIGTPEEVYSNPNCLFVASFIGSPAMNFLKGVFEDGTLNVAGQKIDFHNDASSIDKFYKSQLELIDNAIQNLQNQFEGELLDIESKKLLEVKERLSLAASSKKYELVVGIRPENIISANKSSNIKFKAKIESFELSGMNYHVFLDIEGQKAMAIIPSSNKISVGNEIAVSFSLNEIHLFDAITEKRISL